ALVILAAAGVLIFILANQNSAANKLNIELLSNNGTPRVKYQSGENILIVEVLDDDLLHFEITTSASDQTPDRTIQTSPMILKTDYNGPGTSKIDVTAGTIETNDLRLEVKDGSLCFTITDLTREPDLLLTRICPKDMKENRKRLEVDKSGIQNLYGLGEDFQPYTATNGEWMGRIRTPGNAFGNAMNWFNGGNVGNAQFPILYALGKASENYALFLDIPNAIRWDFSGNPWSIETSSAALRGYILSGPDLPDLRADYMELVGRPTIPPKTAFGLWVSEYGYDNWAELENKLSTLRENKFPVDGFVLDLQWYGGITEDSENTRMGSLTWDTINFPDPAAKIAQLREEDGVSLIAIEQSYIGAALPEHAALQEKGFLVRKCADCNPVYLDDNPWWGLGGMIDWTNPAAGVYWHDTKRQPLIDAGLVGHWTDLGEPELYDPQGWYAGINGQNLERDVHNLYNLMWAQSIAEGYARNNVTQRPFILSRSGAPGIQRYGVAMWSGDIASNMGALSVHFNAQMHMSLSGIDYFGSDIGGFFREALDGEEGEVYTRWFANSALLDVPVRVHTKNLSNSYETAPDRVGNRQSNLEAIRLRYSLIPYLYSLAYQAAEFGDPVYPPLVYYFQNDPNVRNNADQKMIGPWLMAAVSASNTQNFRNVYLPAGTWINYYTHEWINSDGKELASQPVKDGEAVRLPLFARAGAIIPMMYVDEQTMNSSGRRLDGSTRDELIVTLYATPLNSSTSFTLYE
ncbi:MAG TPA: TIM-barrel domain-containing protein, partial [Anaerolineaceae bacterium]|nr:TIM-barrel domain-containing protein [Anaerolineaceae bacterium]